MKQYLVTGAAGFIGSSLARKLVEKDASVTTIDNLSTGRMSAIPEGVEFIEGNCQNPEIIASLTSRKWDAIFHIAGQSSGEISFDDPVYDLQTNAQSTLLLLDLCRKTGCKTFVYASSMSVYGDVPDIAIAEDTPPHPKSFYGVGKLASEHYMHIYTQFGIGTTALRLFNVYGPGQNMDNMRQGMVSIFLSQAIRQRSIHVKGSKDRFRDFIYIDEVVHAFEKAAENSEAGRFRLYNLCSGVKTRVEEVVQTIADSLGGNLPVQFEGSTLGDQFGIFGNPELMKKAWGWSPEIPFASGIKSMVEWAKNE